jgi:hypothetical protein
VGNKKNTEPELNILESISAVDGLVILKKLAREDTALLKRIENTAIEIFREVMIEDVADEVFCDLDSLEVEEIWDSSGATRDGYVDPVDKAWEMFENAIEPYLEELKKCQGLKLSKEAKKHCLGILKGIYKFEKESGSEYKDWAADVPDGIFENVFNEWKKHCTDQNDIEEVKNFIKKNFLDWEIREY